MGASMKQYWSWMVTVDSGEEPMIRYVFYNQLYAFIFFKKFKKQNQGRAPVGQPDRSVNQRQNLDGQCAASALYVEGVVQSLSHVWLLATPWTAAHWAFLPFTISQRVL